MRSGAAPKIGVEVHRSFDDLPQALLDFLDAAGRRDFFRGVAWFRTLVRMTGPGEDRIRLYAALHAGRIVAALIARERQAAGKLRAHMLLSPSQGENAAIYGPLLDGELGPVGLDAIARTIARERPRFDVLRFDGLDRASAEFALLNGAFRRAGMAVQRFFNFHTWVETVAGLTAAQYLAARPAQMREAVGRHLRPAVADADTRFELVRGGAGLSAALIDYALVDLQSGTALETYPDFTLELVRIAAAAGVLRLGLLYVEDEPAAAQIWLVSGGKATLWRPRYAERFARRAVDVALMAAMLRDLLDVERVAEIEFARDVADHGGGWLTGRRERVGLLVFNPRTLRGSLAAVRHIGGHVAKAAARRIRPLIPIRIVPR
jgi:Acetyltransferase (GNAT) domain